MKPILVAVDGSEPSLKGVRMAAEVARASGSALTLAYAIMPQSVPMPASPELVERLEEGTEAQARFVMDSASSLAADLGVKAEPLILYGAPAESLADAAEARDMWMVVVGSRGRGGAARVLLGSVADRLVHISKRPVLVVK